jgi:hypothetical protein
MGRGGRLGKSGRDPDSGRGVGDVMLDGKRYFACFPDEAHAGPQADQPCANARMLTPGLLAALEDLDRELRSFLKETSDEAGDDRRG